MSSILTNNSAMVALETLRGINKGLNQVQNQISTGKKIATAQDNAAIWAISTTMSTDVSSFELISDSLNLGSATVGVARSNAERVTGLIEDVKGQIVAAQEDNVDRSKIQADIEEIVANIGSIVNGSQFNGQNLLNGDGTISILASLDRDSNNNVEAASISVSRVDLRTNDAVAGTTITSGNAGFAAAGAASIADGADQDVTFTAGTIATGDNFTVTLGGTDYTYTAESGDTLGDVTDGLKTVIDAAGLANITVTSTPGADPTANNSVLNVANGTGGAVTLAATSDTGAETRGGLAALSEIDVTSDHAGALSQIEGLLQTAIDAAAAFGSKERRIENQVEFVTGLADALKTGIGALTDADMEEASARLQSLQVQQQLGVQALSIANQSPQNLLSLFQ